MVEEAGYIIRSARKRKGMTIEGTAKAIGISHPYLSMVENSKSLPTDQVAQRIAEILDLDFDELRKSLNDERYKNEQAKIKQRYPLQYSVGSASVLDNLGHLPPGHGYAGNIPAAPASDWVSIPILGEVPAGKPIEVSPQAIPEDYIQLPKDAVNGSDGIYGLRITGDSMSPELSSGDLVIVDGNVRPESGEIAIILYEGESTIKRYRSIAGGVILESINEEYEDILIPAAQVERLVFQGTIIGSYNDRRRRRMPNKITALP